MSSSTGTSSTWPAGPQASGPISGLKVIDCSTILAGPMTACVLGDFGADVIKIEHPDGDALRKMGYSKDGIGLWWKVVSRNKRSLVLDLHADAGKDVLRAPESFEVAVGIGRVQLNVMLAQLHPAMR